MSAFKAFAASLSFLWVFVYLFASFVQFNIDPTEWDSAARFWVVIFWVVSVAPAIMSGLAAAEEHH